MTEKRYFEREWRGEYYIFDSEIISEKDFDEKVQYEDYRAFADSMTSEEIVDRLNTYSQYLIEAGKLIENGVELAKENRHIKQTIQSMMESERTEIGKNILKQLYEVINNE